MVTALHNQTQSCAPSTREGAAARFTQHRRRRQGERGAALFIVTLAILMLTGLGVWATYAAGNLERASGYARAAMQTQYIAEMGILAGTAYLSLPGYARENVRLARDQRETCNSTGLTPNVDCHGIALQDIEAADAMNGLLLDSGADGSLGASGLTQGDFTVELTSPVNRPAPGSALSQSSAGASYTFAEVTLTSYGVVRPTPGGALTPGDLCTSAAGTSLAENRTAGRVVVRANAIVGPLD